MDRGPARRRSSAWTPLPCCWWERAVVAGYPALLAKEWAEGRNHWLFAAGLVAFGALFAVYAVSLKVAELSTATFGWVVTLQVGLLLLERIRFAVELPNGKWAAIVAILVILASAWITVISLELVAHR